jgi:hypothetical protein
MAVLCEGGECFVGMQEPAGSFAGTFRYGRGTRCAESPKQQPPTAAS